MKTKRELTEMMVVKLGAKWPSGIVHDVCFIGWHDSSMAFKKPEERGEPDYIVPASNFYYEVSRDEFDECVNELQGKSKFHKKPRVWLGCVNVPPVGSLCDYIEEGNAGILVRITGHEYNTEDCNWYCHYKWGKSEIHNIARWDRFRPHKDVRDYNLQPKD